MRGNDDSAVERSIGIDVRFHTETTVLALGKGSTHRTQLDQCAPSCGEEGRLGPDSDARLNHCGDVRAAQHRIPVFGNIQGRDEYTGPLAGGKDSAAGELTDRFADSRAPHTDLGERAWSLRVRSEKMKQ